MVQTFGLASRVLQVLGLNNSTPTKEEQRMRDEWNEMEREMMEPEIAADIKNTKPAPKKIKVPAGKPRPRKRDDTPIERSKGENVNQAVGRTVEIWIRKEVQVPLVERPYTCTCVRGCPRYECPICFGAGVERLNGEYVQCSECAGSETITWCQLARDMGFIPE